MWVFLAPPAFCWWLLFHHLPYRWRVRRLVQGGELAAWDRLVDLWGRADCLYGSMVGPDLDSQIENDALEAYVTRHEGSEAHCFAALAHENRYVCAYALRAIWRIRVTRGDKLLLGELPTHLLERSDPIDQQWGCFMWSTGLGEYTRDRAAEGA
tara:strand:+ start:1029 stop:1490 length:462 start_codon:yes stop_codon:yes gene_type:complete